MQDDPTDALQDTLEHVRETVRTNAIQWWESLSLSSRHRAWGLLTDPERIYLATILDRALLSPVERATRAPGYFG